MKVFEFKVLNRLYVANALIKLLKLPSEAANKIDFGNVIRIKEISRVPFKFIHIMIHQWGKFAIYVIRKNY